MLQVFYIDPLNAAIPLYLDMRVLSTRRLGIRARGASGLSGARTVPRFRRLRRQLLQLFLASVQSATGPACRALCAHWAHLGDL